MPKLTVVVTCSSRKRLEAAPALQVRSLEPASIDVRASAWCLRLRTATDTMAPLEELYQGESWSMTGALMRSAAKAGFTPRLLVASAGLGLRAASSSAPGYAATFAPGHRDSVGRDRAERRGWWRALRGATHALDPDSHLRGAVLLVMSENYADAVHDDLLSLAGRTGDALLVGGSVDVPGLNRLPADRGLRPHLGGTASSLNTRTALAWLDRLPRPVLGGDQIVLRDWQRWAQQVRRVERWDRTALTDQEVVEYANKLLQHQPGISASQALRGLRTSGHACEQRRFANLFSHALLGVKRAPDRTKAEKT